MFSDNFPTYKFQLCLAQNWDQALLSLRNGEFYQPKQFDDFYSLVKETRLSNGTISDLVDQSNSLEDLVKILGFPRKGIFTERKCYLNDFPIFF